MRPGIGPASNEYRAVCVYTGPTPTGPQCGQPATTHVVAEGDEVGVVGLETCGEHVAIARAVPTYVADHPHAGYCGLPASIWLPGENVCVIDDTGEEPSLTLHLRQEATPMTIESFALKVLATVAEADLHGELYWRTDAEYAPVSFFINCSDTFAWGSADAEPLTADNLAEFEQALRDATEASGSNLYGPVLFCARQRKVRPQGAAYPSNKKLWPLFDACGPERATGLGNPHRPGRKPA